MAQALHSGVEWKHQRKSFLEGKRNDFYFEDAAYSDVFVTGDETLARRGRSLRLSSPRILLTEEWVA